MSSNIDWGTRKTASVAVNLAVIPTKCGGDGWESNPPRTPQQRPANSFETAVWRPSLSADVRDRFESRAGYYANVCGRAPTFAKMAVILAVVGGLGHLSKLYRTQADSGLSGARLACGHSRAHNTSKLGREITYSPLGPWHYLEVIGPDSDQPKPAA